MNSKTEGDVGGGNGADQIFGGVDFGGVDFGALFFFLCPERFAGILVGVCSICEEHFHGDVFDG